MENFLVLQAARSLTLPDVLHLQAASTAIREDCIEKTLWCDLLCSEYPGLDLSPGLLQSACRHNLAPLLRELRQPHIGVTGQNVQLKSVTAVRQLVKLLGTANRSAQASLSNGGSPGCILVGCMCFPSKALAMALPRRPSALDSCTNDEMGTLFCIGESFPVQCTGLLGKLAANSCGAPIMPDTLFLHMKWEGSRLFLSLHSNGDVSDSQKVSVDIAVCSSAFLLNYRNVEVVVNGTWHACCTGFFEMTGGRAATIEALSNGVPCVVRVCCGQSTPTRSRRISASLNLDILRR
jgi:hypothetical protein